MTRYLTLAEFFWLASEVTGLDALTLTKASRVELADSALHAPAAGFGDVDFYPDLLDKAAVLVCRLAWNHPRPDGNKRAAWVSLAMFLALNGWVFPRSARCRRGRGVHARRRGPRRRRGLGAKLARQPHRARTRRARRMTVIPAEV